MKILMGGKVRDGPATPSFLFSEEAALLQLWDKYIFPNYDRITSNQNLLTHESLLSEFRDLYERID